MLPMFELETCEVPNAFWEGCQESELGSDRLSRMVRVPMSSGEPLSR